MKIYIFLFAWLSMAGASFLPTTTLLTGTVTDDQGVKLAGATVKALQKGILIRGVITDIDGNYRMSVDSGSYTIEVNYTGYQTVRTEGVPVKDGQLNQQDFTLTSSTALEEVAITSYKVPLIQKDAAESGQSIALGRAISTSSRMEAKKTAKVRKPAPSSKVVSGNNVPVMAPAYTTSPTTPQPKEKAASETETRRDKSIRDSLIESTDEQYNTILENPYQETDRNNISTFSIDVDAASYANLRRFINSGQLPPKDAVRIEEMVNYFDYQYPQPTGAHPFEVSTELAACPWAPEHKLLLIGLQGQSMDIGQLPAANLVFLIDVSGSMSSEDKLPLVQQSLNLLTEQLRPNDHVAIVVYAGAAGTVLESTAGSDKVKIKEAIN
ncbi:MAG: von Willebrand factor type A domain-containing protein, partial [Saprospiraceae bacterium]